MSIVIALNIVVACIALHVRGGGIIASWNGDRPAANPPAVAVATVSPGGVEDPGVVLVSTGR